MKRRTDVVGVFPNDAAIDRRITAVIVEARRMGRRRYLSETSMARLHQSTHLALPASSGGNKRLAV